MHHTNSEACSSGHVDLHVDYVQRHGNMINIHDCPLIEGVFRIQGPSALHSTSYPLLHAYHSALKPAFTRVLMHGKGTHKTLKVFALHTLTLALQHLYYAKPRDRLGVSRTLRSTFSVSHNLNHQLL